MIEDLLSALEKAWHDRFMLYAQNGYLLLVVARTGEVIQSYRIHCDGGDVGTVERNGREYLDW